ncbi:MAG: cysteine dioxygenase [Saprospiraceae bacterium]|jgi:cysteine dioxygenase
MNSIKTIEKFTETLLETEICDFPKVIRKTQLSLKELYSYASWKSNDYTRNCLARNEKFEIILLCWDGGIQTPIHDHGGKDCWVYQIKGCIDEVRYVKNGDHLSESNRIKINPGGLSFINDKMGYHSIENNSDQRAMSLHIYASPIDSCMVFNAQKECFEEQDLSYDSYKGENVDVALTV